MSMRPSARWRLIASLAVLILLAGGVFYGIRHYRSKPTPVVTSTHKEVLKSTPPKPQQAVVKSFYIGDTQTYNGITITVTSAQPVPTGKYIPAGDSLFEVEMSLTNNTQTPYSAEQDLLNSSLYVQQSSNTSTGKYVQASDAPCSTNFVTPGQTLSTCATFDLPDTYLADTYFYQNLKWYL